MKKSDIYEITIKILGLYLFFNSIGLLREVIRTFIFMPQTKFYPDLFGNISQAPYLIISRT